MIHSDAVVGEDEFQNQQVSVTVLPTPMTTMDNAKSAQLHHFAHAMLHKNCGAFLISFGVCLTLARSIFSYPSIFSILPLVGVLLLVAASVTGIFTSITVLRANLMPAKLLCIAHLICVAIGTAFICFPYLWMIIFDVMIVGGAIVFYTGVMTWVYYYHGVGTLILLLKK